MTAHATAQLPDADYRERAAAVLRGVEAQADRWLQDDLIDIDTLRSGNLLELGFPNGSKLVLNLQPPLQELWLAARRGGLHFRFDGGHWRTRDGAELFDTLSACASEQGGCPLRFASA
jgi:CyaY protein